MARGGRSPRKASMGRTVRHRSRFRQTGMVGSRCRRADAALRESEACMQALFHEAGIGIAFISQWGRVLDANPCLTSFLGYAGPEGFGQKCFSDAVYSEDRQEVQKLLVQLREGKLTFVSHRKAICADRWTGGPRFAHGFTSCLREPETVRRHGASHGGRWFVGPFG